VEQKLSQYYYTLWDHVHGPSITVTKHGVRTTAKDVRLGQRWPKGHMTGVHCEDFWLPVQ